MVRPIRMIPTEYVPIRSVEFDLVELSPQPTPGSGMAMPPAEQKGSFISSATKDVLAQVRAAIAIILGMISSRVLLIPGHQTARDPAIEILRPHCTVLAVHSATDRGYRVMHSTEEDWPVDSIIRPDHVRSLH